MRPGSIGWNGESLISLSCFLQFLLAPRQSLRLGRIPFFLWWNQTLPIQVYQASVTANPAVQLAAHMPLVISARGLVKHTVGGEPMPWRPEWPYWNASRAIPHPDGEAVALEVPGAQLVAVEPGVEHAQVNTPTGWRQEMKIPWTNRTTSSCTNKESGTNILEVR